MDTQRTSRPVWRTTRLTLTRHLPPAALGACVAALLGSAGFGLGCLYGQLADATPAIARASPAAVPAARVAATEPMGGPEEAGPAALATLTVVPAHFQVSQPGQLLAMSRPVIGGWVSSPFGPRLDPFTGHPAAHQGLDFAGLDNSAILASASGVVTWVGSRRGYGNLIEIDHGNGWVTRYGHNAYNLVTAGDYVKPGQTIALMGSTGRATGTHLHFEVLYRGRHQNPARFVPRDA